MDLLNLENSVKKNNSGIKRIAYIGVVADLFHYGHLRSIQFAKSQADYLICGVFTDEAVESYRVKPIANLEERKAVVESLKFVDKVMVQTSRDPTENLKRIHDESPEAELVLIHGDNWQKIPGAAFVKNKGGEVLQHPYYSRLSTFKIINKIVENKDKFKDIHNFISYIKKNGEVKEVDDHSTIVSTKAETLKTLATILKKSDVEPMFSFTVSEWKVNKERIIETISKIFNSKIVVRSSAVNEDTVERSMAGCFESVLNINSNDKLDVEKAVIKVLNSYAEKQSESSFNQILIQKQTENVTMSGVIFTRTLERNAPYYTINYDDCSGSTDSVTSGKENKTIIISKYSSNIPEKMQSLIIAVKEIEEIIPHLPLDIEFAIRDNNEVVIFQVRPLAVNSNKKNIDFSLKTKLEEIASKFKNLSIPNHLPGEKTFFADMPDWNPAEIIGDNPNYLDYSLYHYLITENASHDARATQGYYQVKNSPLVELFGNKPYVNVRTSFNAYIPNSISSVLRSKLINFYLKKLESNPHLHDKVEFDILYTCFDLTFDERSKELSLENFSNEEIKDLRSSLIQLTNNLVSVKSINEDMSDVFNMENLRNEIKEKVNLENSSPRELITAAKTLLEECRKNGTEQFSRLARQGFIGKIILKSLTKKKIIDQETYDKFFNSISTVATNISDDFKKLSAKEISKDDFLKKYYHLRPGTYDITSLRYETNPDLLKVSQLPLNRSEVKDFKLNEEKLQEITSTFCKENLSFNATEFFNFARLATESRELAKFEFTKNLSDAIEFIAKAGEKLGFTRKEMSMLDIKEILMVVEEENLQKILHVWKEMIQTREKEKITNENLVLPAILFSEKDFEVIEHYNAKPNFITQKIIESYVVKIDRTDHIPQVEGKIVVLENGDPGYDWIFTRNPAGLITKYGGVASHMSIRCAEFGIPAAIGCGELIFNRIKNAKNVFLDCKNKKISPY